MYQVRVPYESQFTAIVQDMGPALDFDLYLYDANGTELARSTQPGNAPEQVQLALPAGNYQVRVYFRQGSPTAPHDVRWSWAPVR